MLNIYKVGPKVFNLMDIGRNQELFSELIHLCPTEPNITSSSKLAINN